MIYVSDIEFIATIDNTEKTGITSLILVKLYLNSS